MKFKDLNKILEESFKVEKKGSRFKEFVDAVVLLSQPAWGLYFQKREKYNVEEIMESIEDNIFISYAEQRELKEKHHLLMQELTVLFKSFKKMAWEQAQEKEEWGISLHYGQY